MEVTNANTLRASTIVILKSQFQQLFLAPPPIKLELHWWSHSKKLWLLSYSVQSSLVVHGSSKVNNNNNNNNNNNFYYFSLLPFLLPLFLFLFLFYSSLAFSLCVFSFFLPFSGSCLCKSLSLTHLPKPLLLSLYL